MTPQTPRLNDKPPADRDAGVACGSVEQDTLPGLEELATSRRQRSPYDAHWRRLVELVLERDGWACHWCGKTATTGDHVVALADGGARLDPSNVVAACKPCNSRRGQELATARRVLGPRSRQW